jgi:hypothetical protein
MRWILAVGTTMSKFPCPTEDLLPSTARWLGSQCGREDSNLHELALTGT